MAYLECHIQKLKSQQIVNTAFSRKKTSRLLEFKSLKNKKTLLYFLHSTAEGIYLKITYMHTNCEIEFKCKMLKYSIYSEKK